MSDLQTKADALAETINAIAGLCTYQHESKEDFIGRVRAVLGDDPHLRLSSVRQQNKKLTEQRDLAIKTLAEAKSNLMHHRRFGIDTLQAWKNVATRTEADIEESLAIINES